MTYDDQRNLRSVQSTSYREVYPLGSTHVYKVTIETHLLLTEI